ncbi:hypothetical protein ACI6Q5_05520 [Xanthomonas codiaei]|uniref:Uncharacterized protein n=1 Tax=Xanthomonas codiaei TaxID=56463 RepID=A0A2S7CGW7_9XANT|nr:hypothetical protein [Xanthomonas codiaei]PPU60774.1 hypothetical protein XcodCFBP4690_16980 [Xanthomonas codiaei]
MKVDFAGWDTDLLAKRIRIRAKKDTDLGYPDSGRVSAAANERNQLRKRIYIIYIGLHAKPLIYHAGP